MTFRGERLLIEVGMFILISGFCNAMGLLKRRNKLTQGVIVAILFYSYGIASASTALTSYALALYSGNQVISDSISLCTGVFFAIELLLAVGVYNFYKKIW